MKKKNSQKKIGINGLDSERKLYDKMEHRELQTAKYLKLSEFCLPEVINKDVIDNYQTHEELYR